MKLERVITDKEIRECAKKAVELIKNKWDESGKIYNPEDIDALEELLNLGIDLQRNSVGESNLDYFIYDIYEIIFIL